MTTFERSGSVLDQPDARLIDYPSVADAARSDLELDANEPVLILSDKGRLYELNLVAAVLWEALAHKATAPELTALVTDVFDIDEAAARHDVMECLTDMRHNSLVTGHD